MRSWLSPRKRNLRRTHCPRALGSQLRLERLEDRTLPSVSPVLHLPIANLNLSGMTRSQPMTPVNPAANGNAVNLGLATAAEATGSLPGKAADAAPFDVSVTWQTASQVTISVDGVAKFSFTLSWNANGEQSTAPWFMTVTFGQEHGQNTETGQGGDSTFHNPASPEARNSEAQPVRASSSDLTNSSSSTTPTVPGTSQPGQIPGLGQLLSGQQNTSNPGQNTPQTFQFGASAEGTARPNPVQQVIVVVPVVLMGEVPVVGVVDVVEGVLPPAPSVPAVAPVLPSLQTATHIESGGGDNLPLPDQQQLDQLLYWLMNGVWVQQPGPALSPENGNTVPTGPALDAQALTALQQVADGALFSSAEQVTEKKAPDPAPETDGPGREITDRKTLTGAAVLGLVLGGYWAQYGEEEAETTEKPERR
jgi:hypothetical protein